MKLDRIRNMNDEELTSFLNKLSRSSICNRCGNFVNSFNKKTVHIGIYNHSGQKIKKLCSLCEDCYSDLLDYLAVPDINWEGVSK